MLNENNSVVSMREPRRGSLLPLFGLIFLVIVFLTPLIVFPGVGSLLFATKLAVVSVLAALSVIILLLNVLSTGELEFPKSKITLALLLIPIAAFISSFFSDNIINSIVGSVLEVGTVGSLVFFAALFIISMIAGAKENIIKRAIGTFLLSLGLSLIYTIVISAMQRGWIPPVTGLPFNLAGSYVDLSILLGLGILFSIYMLSFSASSLKTKIALWILIVISLAYIGAIGFMPIIITLGLFSLVVFIYIISVFRSEGHFWIKKSYGTLVVLLASIILILAGKSFGGFLSSSLGVNALEVRPNIESTMGIIKSQWIVNPITGSGPNTFGKLWAMYRPVDINLSAFWNSDFFFGFGLIPTLAATTGLVGLVAIFTFLVLYIRRGFSVFFSQTKDNLKFLSIFLFLASFFLWIAMFFYTPSITVLVFTFIFSGLFISSLSHTGIFNNARINIFSNPKANFISVFLTVLLMIGIVSAQYLVLERVAASVIFNRAVMAFNGDGNTAKAQASLTRAIDIKPVDIYERSLAELYLLDIERMIASIPSSGQIDEAQRAELQNNIAKALERARAAIALNSNNYQNHLTLARIYESLALRGIQGAADGSKAAYADALKLNPKNPSIQLAYARLSAFEGDGAKAREYIDNALKLKGNYTDAYFTLAQLEAASNNITGVIKAVESATFIDPTNAGLYFQLGLIKYQVNDNEGAIQALEKAVTLVPDYANAKYFLGLSYYRLRRWDSAVAEFEGIKKTNPENKEVGLILSNLKAKKDPFTGAEPPVDSKPEKRKNPPIGE